MKRVLCSALTVLLIIMLMAPCAAAAPQKLNAFEKYIQYRDPLTHTYKCLTEDKELNVVYFGGSVTAGYGSTDGNRYSWRALSEQWLKTNFPEAKFRITNTAIGESGTFLGTYRVKDDVIDKNPDLLFIEYAINDKYKGCSKEQAALQYETIVREVRTALPNCDIVTLLVTDDSASNSLPELYPTAAGHEMIAKAYNISTVNVGASLVESMKDKKAEWSKYFIDIVHPTDAGYQKYYECLEEYLYNSLKATDFTGLTEGHIMPELQSDHLLDGNRMSLVGIKMRPYLVSLNGFTYKDKLYYGPTDTPHIGYYECAKGTENAEIIFRFFGTEFALWTDFYNKSAVNISVDGGAEKRVTCDSHAPTLLVKELAPGNHYISIKPVTFGDGESMKIGAVFFRDDTKQSGNAVDPSTRVEEEEKEDLGENHTHTYGKWTGDEDVHWHQCACGDVTDWAYHTYGEWVNVGGYDFERVCSVCGYVLEGTATAPDEEPVPDSEDTTFIPDGNDPADGDTDRVDQNTDSEDDGKGKVKTRKRRVITYEFTPAFYALVIGGGLVLVAGITVLIIFIVKKRKKKKNLGK